MGPTFRSPFSFDEISLETDLYQLSKAPLFHRKSLSDKAQIRIYAMDGWLPPHICVFKLCWLTPFAVDDRDLRVACDRSLAGVRRGFV